MSGIEIKKIEEILQELQEIAKRRFKDLAEPNDSIDVSDSSILGRILGIIAEPESLNEELLLSLWKSLDPEQAEGIFLDKILALYGIVRRAETRGYSGLILHGKMGQFVDEKSQVTSVVTGDVFETTSFVQFTNINTNGVVLSITDITPDQTYSLGYTGSYGINIFPTISTKSVAGDTKNMIARRLSETINAVSSLLESSVNNDDTVVVRFKNRDYVGNLTTDSPSMTIIESYMPVSAIAITENAGRQGAGTLNIIQTSAIGWIGVTNPFDSIPSEAAEDDAKLRARARVSKAIKSSSTRLAMYSDLYDLDGVQYVNIKENIYDNPTGGRAAKGISVVVLGGDDDRIAETILDNKPLGCLTDGVIEKTISDAAGSVDIRFSRPEFVSVVVDISLITEYNFPQNGKALIQDAIVSYFDQLDVGESVIWSKLFEPINTVQGQSVNTLNIATEGGVPSQTNIPMNYNQKAVITFENINI